MKAEKKDEERLYEQLMFEVGEFCKKLDWFSEKALESDAPDRFQQMWEVYFSVMSKVRSEVFKEDVCWNTHSDLIDPVLDMLLNSNYAKIIIQLILGANNLLYAVKSDGYEYKSPKLQSIADQYYEIIQRYKNGGVLTTQNQMLKWDFIDHSNRLFGAAVSIVYDSSCPPKSEKELEKEQEDRENVGRMYREMLSGAFEEARHPIRYNIKKLFRKIFPKRRR